MVIQKSEKEFIIEGGMMHAYSNEEQGTTFVTYKRSYDVFSAILRLGISKNELTRFEKQTFMLRIRCASGDLVSLLSINNNELSISHTFTSDTDYQPLYTQYLLQAPTDHRVTHIALDRQDRVALSPVVPLHRASLKHFFRLENLCYPWLRERFNHLQNELTHLLNVSEDDPAETLKRFELATTLFVSLLA